MMQSSSDIQIESFAEDAWLLRFGDTVEIDINVRVLTTAARLRSNLAGVECVPAFASLLLRFDPTKWKDDDGCFSDHRLREAIHAVVRVGGALELHSRDLIIPVFYGGEAGEDLEHVAAHVHLSRDEVIARHTGITYRVAMLGFAPGFPYLLGLDPALAMPRRSSPRTRVPSGSVAIGGLQTGIYPQELPGGWQLIGRTPLRLFDVTADVPSLLQPGDRVRFQSIDAHEYRRLTDGAHTTA